MQGFASLSALALARLLLAGALLVMLHACGGGGGGDGGGAANPSPQVIEGNYFPTTTGAVWIHKASDGSTYTLKVIGPQAVAQGQATTFQGQWSDLPEPFSYLVLATPSEVKELGSLSSDGFERALGDVTLFRLPLTLGAEVVKVDKTIDAGIDIDGDQISDRLTLREVTRVAAVESVVTAVGNFANAVRIRSVTERTYRSSVSSRDVRGTFTKDEWYVRDLGLVRYENTLKRDDGSESKFSYELSAYGVGALRSENQAPQVTSSTPASGGVISYAWGVQLQFSEELDPSSANPQTIRVLDAQGNAIAASVQLFGRDVNVAFSNSLPVGRYEVQINGVTDILGNAISNLRWSFDVDTMAPTILSTLPANDAVDVDPLASIRIEFNEDINPNNAQLAQFTLFEQSFCCTSIATQATLVGPRSIVITPAAPLKKRMRYTLSGTAYDKAGNGVGVQTSFTTVPEWFTFARRPAQVVPARATAIGDLTGDGRADLVVVSEYSGSATLPVVIYPQRADGTLGDALPPTSLRPSCASWFGGFKAQVLDVNGDGRNDLALSGDGCGAMVLVAGPSGDFERAVTIATTWVPRARFADMNGDGRLDAVTQSAPFFVETQVEVRLQLADGSFGSPQTVASAPLSDFAVADMNNDGRPDLVLAGALAPGRNVAWAPQLVDGGFGALNYLSHPVDANLQFVAVADLDGNGRLDIVAATASYNGLVMSLWHQASDGSFGAAATLPGREGVVGVSVADLDGDGRLDVVGHQPSSGGLAVYRQTQAATYAPVEYLVGSSNFGSSNPAYGDLNGDGKTDFVMQTAEVAYFIGAPARTAAPSPQKPNPTPVRRKAPVMTQH
jgi:Bacterial Ig-like domain/FG-GAP-like repeat